MVLGPDGSGKSTILEAVKPELAGHFTIIDHRHWRPGLLPKPGRDSSGPVSQPDNASKAPPRDFAYGRLMSMVRYFYYLTDFILGYHFSIAPVIRRHGLVIIERWHHDTLMNPQRYGFRVPVMLLRIAHALLPKPDLVMVLHGDPEKIHARKSELTVDEIREQTCAIMNLVPLLPASIRVYTDTRLEISCKAFIDGITAVANAASDSGRSEWRAFPRFGRPLLWVNRKHSLASLGDLYTPRSWRARLAVAMARMLPKLVSMRRLGPAEQVHTIRISLAVRETFPEHQDLALDFYIGTPGPHQKLIARIATGLGILSYCKVGTGTDARKDLENEHRASEAIDSSIAVTPAILSRMERDGWHMLVTTPAPDNSSPWPLDINPVELNFLASLVTEHQPTTPIGNIIDGLKTLPHRLSDEQKQIIACCRQHLQHSFWANDVRTVVAHGDFAAWNMRKLADNRLYLFDWEYFNPQAPVLTDLFHRIFSVEWLVRKSDARRIVHKLLTIHRRQSFHTLLEKSGITRELLPAYLLLYLLGLLHRRSLGCDTPPGLITDCMRLVLISEKDSRCRPKILVSAYACEPGEGSEPGVGWHWSKEISQFADTWVITRLNNRSVIEQAMAQSPNKHLHFIYTDLPLWLARWKRKQRGVRTYYYLWQFAALAKFRELSKNENFDAGHHITFVNDWLWTFFALTRIPFVWGPIGSHPPLPFRLIPSYGDKLRELAKRMIQNGMRTIDPLFWLSALRASAIVGINRQVSERFPLSLFASNKFSVEPAIGIDTADHAEERGSDSDFRVLYVGRFVAVKATHLALESFAEFAQQQPGATLTMIGRGPTERHLRNRIAAYGLQDRIKLLDWMSREQVRRQMSKADVFLFPSLEGGGLVVLEAMAAGLPVVCLNYGGPGTMVTEDTGLRIAPGPEAAIITDLAQALTGLANDPDERSTLARNAQRHALGSFSWPAKQLRAWQFYHRTIFGDMFD